MNQRPRNFLFFNLIPKTVFLVTVGVFTNFTLLFLTLNCILTQVIYAQLACFFSLGILVFGTSYLLYKHKFFAILKIPSYKSYTISRKKLMSWMFITLNLYLLLCWYFMWLLGQFNGFNIKSPHSPHMFTLIDNNPQLMIFRALILMFVHLFLLSVYFFGKRRISKMLIIAHHKLNIRRKNIEVSKDDAARVVYQ